MVDITLHYFYPFNLIPRGTNGYDTPRRYPSEERRVIRELLFLTKSLLTIVNYREIAAP
jgi:hypothetical protein